MRGQAGAVDALLFRCRGRPAVLLNAEWGAAGALPERHAALAASFDVVYCFEPIAVRVRSPALVPVGAGDRMLRAATIIVGHGMVMAGCCGATHRTACVLLVTGPIHLRETSLAAPGILHDHGGPGAAARRARRGGGRALAHLQARRLGRRAQAHRAAAKAAERSGAARRHVLHVMIHAQVWFAGTRA